MNKRFLKKIILILCTLLLAIQFNANSQSTDNHFIYIQAKDKKPFYVILNSKVYSSSTIGYLIIPKLKNGTYVLKVGFPKQSSDESIFKCVVNDADIGYSLQKNDTGNLGLFDLQSQNFITASNHPNNYDNTAYQNVANNNDKKSMSETVPAKSAAFGDMLSSVANDSTLNKHTIEEQLKAVMQHQQETLNTTIIQADSFGINPQADANTIIAASRQKYLKPANISNDAQETYGVIKLSDNTNDMGQQMTFVLFNSRTTDTVQIVVPYAAQKSSNNALTNSSTASIVEKNQYGDRSLALFKNSDGDTHISDKNVATDSHSKKKKNKAVHTLDDDASENIDIENKVNNPYYNSTNKDYLASNKYNNPDDNHDDNIEQKTTPPCDNPLTDKELTKMQKKMISKGNDDDMLSVADKAIKGKCITTIQVRQLGSLFLSDAGRFAMYQDAYPLVIDKDNYSSLQNQLLDTYFKNRFLDMLKN